MIADATIKQIKAGAKIRVFEGKVKSPFEGIVLGCKHGGEEGGTFTVRSMIAGVGVEKVYPLKSPLISKIEIVSSPKRIHRSKLYFVRKMSGSTIRKRLGVSL